MIDGSERRIRRGKNDVASNGAEIGGDARMLLNKANLIQVRIDYSIPREHKKGVVFRRQSKSINGNVKKDSGDVTCVYTDGAGGHGVVQDEDGVRCWLPCIDTPDQRAIFDLTLKVPAGVATVASGRKVSTTENSKQQVIVRYVTSRRLPAYSVGFFAGVAEEYKLPLYRVTGKALVALGLGDSVRSRDVAAKKNFLTASSTNEQSPREDDVLCSLSSVRLENLGEIKSTEKGAQEGDLEVESKERLNESEAPRDEDGKPVKKRARTDQREPW